MGIFESISRAFGGLSAQSDEELAAEHEELRLRYVASGDVEEATNLYDELHRYDAEMVRRDNEAYDRENPNPPAHIHREHGRYLPNDD